MMEEFLVITHQALYNTIQCPKNKKYLKEFFRKKNWLLEIQSPTRINPLRERPPVPLDQIIIDGI